MVLELCGAPAYLLRSQRPEWEDDKRNKRLATSHNQSLHIN